MVTANIKYSGDKKALHSYLQGRLLERRKYKNYNILQIRPWNVTILKVEGRLVHIKRQMDWLNLHIVGIRDVRTDDNIILFQDIQL